VNEQSNFWSTVAEKYDRVADLQIGGRTRSMVRDRLQKEGALDSVVEFGCGTGFYTETLATKASTVMATDLSPGMLALARERVRNAKVTFQPEDCQRTAFEGAQFDTAFIGLVIHFTEPRETLREMYRILKPGGILIIVNVDLGALVGIKRLRARARMLYQGLVGYRTRPPKAFGRNMLAEKRLSDLLRASRFEVLGTERLNDQSRSSSIPMDYVRARKPS
jgi:ubiquinone/menaquinone biosynthesis C-methylase UbiE